MREKLLNAMQRAQLVDMVYIAKTKEISKRRIRITKVSRDTFAAFCFTKQAKRTFLVDSVLALVPVIRKEREVI